MLSTFSSSPCSDIYPRGRSSSFTVPAGLVEPAVQVRLYPASIAERRVLRGRNNFTDGFDFSSDSFQQLVESKFGCLSLFCGVGVQPYDVDGNIVKSPPAFAAKRGDGAAALDPASSTTTGKVKASHRFKASVNMARAAGTFQRSASRSMRGGGDPDDDDFNHLEDIPTLEEERRAEARLQESFRRVSRNHSPAPASS